MPSEMVKPDLAETPELYSRIETALHEEARVIRSRHLAGQRRIRWYEGLRPALGATAAIMAVVLVVPLGSSTIGSAVVPAPGEPVPVAVSWDGTYTDRLPDDDIEAVSEPRSDSGTSKNDMLPNDDREAAEPSSVDMLATPPA